VGLVIATSALVAVERSSVTWADAPSAIGNDPAALPAIVYAELLAGVRLAETSARAASRRSKIAALISRVPIVEFGAEAAERPSPQPRSISGLVCSSALATKPIFRGVPGLRVETLTLG